MAGIKECPNCRQPVDEENAFCVFCGTKLPAIAKTVSDKTEAAAGSVKLCPNGHEFDDEKLEYCPICGLPLASADTPAVRIDETWRCRCGADNPSDNVFCQACGKPRGTARHPAPVPRPDVPTVPDGMYFPTDYDLIPRKKRS